VPRARHPAGHRLFAAHPLERPLRNRGPGPRHPSAADLDRPPQRDSWDLRLVPGDRDSGPSKIFHRGRPCAAVPLTAGLGPGRPRNRALRRLLEHKMRRFSSARPGIRVAPERN
jgi:hypothetical protein